MKIEDHVISLELSRRLKELGVKQDSLFYYASYKGYATSLYSTIENIICDNKLLHITDKLYGEEAEEKYSAFAPGELAEMIPEELYQHSLRIHKLGEGWETLYQEGDYPFEHIICYYLADKFSDCMARMLIYLIENKLLEV